MIKIEHTTVEGWEASIRGLRNPLNSWDKSDSDWEFVEDHSIINPNDEVKWVIGDNDISLMEKLVKAGSDHRKFMRFITVSLDITAPLYWWKEFDTYKVGTVANSCSTMHKIHAKEFTLDDFSHEHLITDWVGDNNDSVFYWENNAIKEDLFATPKDGLCIIIGLLNANRDAYLKTKDKKYWWQMIQLLPTSYNQKRTVLLNYEVLRNMYHARRNHRLDEWHDFCKWIETLPYHELITEETK